MALSPSTLFHFTKRKYLMGILKDNFKLKYCFERINHLESPIEYAIPMVSFCDIKLSEIKEHIEKYGYYGIGLSKTWAVEKGLNPVIYLNSSSNFSKGLIGTAQKIITSSEFDSDDQTNIANLIQYTKVYEGELIRKGIKTQAYRYADEREWRYVPNAKENIEPWLSKDKYDTKRKKIEANKTLKDERLYFNANDILYLIVKKESEIRETINHIRAVKSKNYNDIEIDRLTTRIISCERIFSDF